MGRLLVSFAVTPYGGVWIEMYPNGDVCPAAHVTPYGGVWIEILEISQQRNGGMSHALWGRVD